jgi:endogenous inhibitor of DNA gyrase (YacG/DUF329 family)
MIEVSCPICGRAMSSEGPGLWPERPFCSPRCRLIDLGRWLGEGYRLEARPTDIDSEEFEANPPKPAVPSAVPNREEA